MSLPGHLVFNPVRIRLFRFYLVSGVTTADLDGSRRRQGPEPSPSSRHLYACAPLILAPILMKELPKLEVNM